MTGWRGETQPDYIVVGAGSAGSVVAEVLSRNPDHRVLVIEAGRRATFNPWVRIPLGFGKTFADPAVNWCFETALDPGLGRTDFWPRGKIWGGSSAINGLVWVRPFPQDIEAWWPGGWGDLRPHFDRIEYRQNVVGRHGNIHVECPRSFYADHERAVHDAFFEAANQVLDVPFRRHFDFAPDTPPGECVGYYHTNTRGGLRVGCRETFLADALKRRNVDILSDQKVDRVLEESGACRSIRLESGRTISARKEVILCGGAIGSPVVLLRSGLKARLPQLGENLTDHLGINYSFKVNVPTTNSALNSFWGRAVAGLRYVATRRGPLGQGINPAGGFVKTNPSLAEPNIQLYLQSLTTTTGFQKAQTGERPLLEPDPFDAISLGLSTCRPKSRGRVSINASGDPVIQPNSFGDSTDMDEFIAGVRLLRKLAASDPLSALIEAELTPGPTVPDSDEALAEDIRARCGTVYHPVSTCRMGHSATDSVVDRWGCVHGTEGLRVIDASVFPNQISVNTNATTIALAHKLASDMVEAECNRP